MRAIVTEHGDALVALGMIAVGAAITVFVRDPAARPVGGQLTAAGLLALHLDARRD